MNQTARKIVNRSELPALMEQWRGDSQQIVFTNGCFDLLHLGHIDGLEKARRFGDRLIVGLNSDTSVKKIKGPDRPLNNENIISDNKINFLGNEITFEKTKFDKKKYFLGIRPEHFNLSSDSQFKFKPKIDLVENIDCFD